MDEYWSDMRYITIYRYPFVMWLKYMYWCKFQALLLSHPIRQTRDTQFYAYKFALSKSRHISLKNLAKQELGIDIQDGEHSSVCSYSSTSLYDDYSFINWNRWWMLKPRWLYTANIKMIGREQVGRSRIYEDLSAKSLRKFLRRMTC